MPHTTRKNYKSKLLEKKDDLSRATQRTIDVNHKVFEVLEKEEHDKQLLHNLIADVANMSVDLVRKMDEHSDVGELRFAKCEELNDDRLKLYDSFTVLDRVFDIMLMAEERVEELSSVVYESKRLASSFATQIQALELKTDKAQHLRNELYNIGKSPTSDELHQFAAAEAEGEKYVRSFADRSLQTHTPLELDDKEDSGVEDLAPSNVAVAQKEKEVTKTSTKKAAPKKK